MGLAASPEELEYQWVSIAVLSPTSAFSLLPRLHKMLQPWLSVLPVCTSVLRFNFHQVAEGADTCQLHNSSPAINHHYQHTLSIWEHWTFCTKAAV